MAILSVDWAAVVWAIGRRIPRRLGDTMARALSPLVARLRLPAVGAWQKSVEIATGSAPTRWGRTRLVEHWIRNNLWSLGLAGWSRREILAVARPEADTLEKLRSSLDGPGLILALPHMGSWDFAGAWCAQHGIRVVSVAERLPHGVYERFVDARRRMGIAIHPFDARGLMRALAADVKDGFMVCLLADRDLSSRGVEVPWPGSEHKLSVPAGPALLARRTGADLRVATLAYDGPRLRLSVTDPVPIDNPTTMMTDVVGHFAAAVRRSPENWLMLREVFR